MLELKECAEYSGFNNGNCDGMGVHDKLCIDNTDDGSKIYSLSSVGSGTYACRREFTPLDLAPAKLNVVKINGIGKIDNKAYISSETIAGLVNPEAYILVDCNVAPSPGGLYDCKQTDGYFKNGSSVYKFVGTNVGKVVDDFADTGCASTSIGKVINSMGAVCVKPGQSVTFGTPTRTDFTDKLYLIEQGEGVDGTPFQSDEYDVVVKRDPTYIIRDVFHDKGISFHLFFFI